MKYRPYCGADLAGGAASFCMERGKSLPTAEGRGILRFLSEINDVALKYMQIDAADGSKTRQITPISAPTNEQVR